jgi:two-component system chemotaxis response regulator CheY
MRGAGVQVLVVDDDQVSRMVMKHMLTGLGYLTTEAYDVASAIAELTGGRFALILTDLDLPDGTGLDLLDFLHEQEAVAPPLVLVTGVSERDDLSDPRLTQVRSYLTKPVSTAELEASLATLAGSPM